MPQKNNSLLTRLVLRVSLLMIVSIALLSAIVYIQINNTLVSMRDQTVERQARTVAKHLHPSNGLNHVLLDLPDSLRAFYTGAGDDYQYAVVDDMGNILFSSPVAFTDSFPNDFRHIGDGKFTFTGPGGQKYVGVTLQSNVGGRQLYIQVAQTRNVSDVFLDEITSVFAGRLIWIGVPFYLVLVIVIVWTLRRGLEPLHKAAEEVGKLSIADLSLRIAESEVPEEVLPLVHAVNSSFSRLEKSIQEQRELTENIAHELRTPLTILKTRIDTLTETAEKDKLSYDVDAMIKQVNQMLDVTRLEYADTLEKADVDLAEVLSQCCQDFFPLFIKAQRALKVSGVDTPAVITGNKDLIYRAICNLLDNALEYSPSKTPVEAALTGHTITITDYGKKIPGGRRKAIFQRFQKDRSPSAAKSGAGLGLSIVSQTMEIHGGYADLADTDEKQNTFRMVFKEA